jgi:hypothetical protein
MCRYPDRPFAQVYGRADYLALVKDRAKAAGIDALISISPRAHSNLPELFGISVCSNLRGSALPQANHRNVGLFARFVLIAGRRR